MDVIRIQNAIIDAERLGISHQIGVVAPTLLKDPNKR